jgi:glycosyltransferase involved in cell wall biosynthesis
MNQAVTNSMKLRCAFDVSVVPIDVASDLASIRKFSLGKVWRSFRVFMRVLRGLGESRPNLAYLTLSPKGFAFYRDASILMLFRAFRVPHVIHLHGLGMRSGHGSALSQAFARYALRRAIVIHLSNLLIDDVVPFVSSERIRIVPNGVQDLRLPNSSNGPSSIPNILFLGTMLESKGPLVLVEALGILKKRGTGFKAAFAGPWRNSLTPEAFQERVNELDLALDVVHLGPVYGEAKARTLAAADILAFPSHYENEAFPLVVLEGMAAGLVPVTSDIAALPDMVQGAGFCVPKKNPEALADALEALLRDAGLLAALKIKARQKYEREFTQALFEDRLYKVLSEAADAGRKPAGSRMQERSA